MVVYYLLATDIFTHYRSTRLLMNVRLVALSTLVGFCPFAFER
ncbi:hypothetical protein HSB1_06350 [Halogranum salarium B-1]|uniref:Uncharacterized protein n=1 Tax=Halogranum salarium B-1 TaxID=1210908 RepID=J3JI60_9EURY|nr:hypothetical protein HSB1_06350 [Halogranum salarium B-1]